MSRNEVGAVCKFGGTGRISWIYRLTVVRSATITVTHKPRLYANMFIDPLGAQLGGCLRQTGRTDLRTNEIDAIEGVRREASSRKGRAAA